MSVLLGLILCMGLAAMDGTIVATAIPSIVRDLGGFALFPWVFSVYLLVQAATIPIYAKLADLYGRKPVLIAGAGIFLLGSVLSGTSWDMVSLIAFRGLQGVGAGAIMPITLTIVGDLFSVEERARIQGYVSSVWGIAAIVGPAVGGLLVQYASWRWIFYINLPLGGLAIALVALRLHENVQRRPHRIDVAGSALLASGMGALILGLLEGGVGWAWSSPASLAVLGAGLALLVGFVWAEARAPEPMVPLWVFRRRMLVGANLASLIVGTITIGLSSFLPTFVQASLGGTPLVAGFTLAMMSLGWPLASALCGRLYLRLGFRDAALVGAAISALAGTILSGLSVGSPVWLAGLASFVMGLGLGAASTSTLVGVQSVVDWGRRGVVTGAVMFMRTVGSAVGAAVYGSIVNAALAGWLRRAPHALAAHLPRSLDAVASTLGGPSLGARAADPRVARFLAQGIALGVHRVFLALVGAAVLTFLAEAVMPRRASMLSLPGPSVVPAEQRSGATTLPARDGRGRLADG